MTGLEAPPGVQLRRAVPADAGRLADLHATRISEGFLPSLGRGFLTRLYRRIARSERALGFVAEEGGRVVAFATGAESVGRLYKEFLLRDGIVAGIVAAPGLVRSWRRVSETLRYPATHTDLPAPEILAVATDTAAAGRGLGALVLSAVTVELGRRGCTEVKVTVGAENDAALRMYRRCGFATRAQISVHGDDPSEVLVWTAP
jgi:ribosomal protein S18 acetylase RimI-like enzyme